MRILPYPHSPLPCEAFFAIGSAALPPRPRTFMRRSCFLFAVLDDGGTKMSSCSCFGWEELARRGDSFLGQRSLFSVFCCTTTFGARRKCQYLAVVRACVNSKNRFFVFILRPSMVMCLTEGEQYHQESFGRAGLQSPSAATPALRARGRRVAFEESYRRPAKAIAAGLMS